jgi:DNA-binding NarL/FixJ family response regulator
MKRKKPSNVGKNKTRVLIVDDHPIVREGLGRLIELQSDITVCGEAASAHEALKTIKTSSPDVVIVDISLGKGLGGIELIKEIKARFPQLSILVLSMHDETVFAERLIRAGAKGYVMKEEAPEVILTAIRRVSKGQLYLSENMAARILSHLVSTPSEAEKSPIERLSDREFEIVELLGQGFGASQIAETLHLSVKTIETHFLHIKEKLQIENARKLRQYAISWAQSKT